MATQTHSTITLGEGHVALEQLITEVSDRSTDWNEADTRFHFIDRLLVECLGWPRPAMKLEPHARGHYADYLLGTPPSVIWEAKREGIYFDLPASKPTQTIYSLSSS